MSGLVKREAYSVEKHRIDPVMRDQMSEIERSIFELCGSTPIQQVGLRIINAKYTIVAMFKNSKFLNLSFDESHIPGYIRPSDCQMIAQGIMDAYWEKLGRRRKVRSIKPTSRESFARSITS